MMILPITLTAAMTLMAMAWTVAVPAARQKESKMATHARGEFDVKLTPQASADPSMGRMTVEKTYHGDLEGTAKGEMLTGAGDVKESAVYVAIEKVTGTINGRTGTFILHHTGIMTRGAPHLTVTIAPDSGTGGFVGISGTMTITIEKGKHFYDLTLEGM